MDKRLSFLLLVVSLIVGHPLLATAQSSSDEEVRQEYLEELVELQEQPPSDDFVSYHDETWMDWVERTGALPPNFAEVLSIPLLPDPLVLDEGGENVPVETPEQWEEKRAWIEEQAQHILSGTFPEPPEEVTAHVLEEREENGVEVKLVELRFGEDERAKLTLELFIPPGEGPFPVFMTQWNHRGWAQIAVRRGYIGAVYAGADAKDDTRDYLALYPDHDWSTLMTRAWGAHRVVDYLYTLDEVDTESIAITGHSRNGKQSVFAGAFDDRISAVISSSGGTGGEIPYRFTDYRHANEEIEFLVSRRTHWLHPRLRFYAGREHKMPIDQNSLMSLIAPNALLLSSSIREGKAGGDPWAIEQMYHSLEEVYEFLGAPEKLGIRLRDGDHGVSARDIESYLDWLDVQFDRTAASWENELVYNYSFEDWMELSGEEIDPVSFPEIEEPLGMEAETEEDWERERDAIQEQIDWVLGEEPAGVPAEPIRGLSGRVDYIDNLISRPSVSNGRRENISPYNALGDYLYGALYYPTDDDGEMEIGADETLPVVIYLHEFSNTGFDSRLAESLFEDFLDRGIAVLAMDLIGYGQRIEEGTHFYERYPQWSKLGKMVTDTRAAIDALETLEFIDGEQIYLTGYALGGTVSLFTAAQDERVAATAVSSAFTPLRTASEDVEGVQHYSHLYGLLPRLGFFEGHEERLPVDYPEILASIAPRPLFVITPELDRHADNERVEESLEAVEGVYDLFEASAGQIEWSTPHDFNRFSSEQQQAIVDWLADQGGL